jgi:hypothetical protein
VRFALTPAGAVLELDGARFDWFGTKELAPGSYGVRVLPPPAAQSCCDALSTTVTITPPPRDDPEAKQTVPLALVIRPARVILTGAPPDGMMSCGSMTVSAGRSGTMQLPQSDISWSGSCSFLPLGTSTTVMFKAGEIATVPWPI